MSLGRLRGLPPPAPLASLREGASPVAKLYNWNLLAPALRPFDIEVDTDTKARIVAGDLDVVAGLLCRFYERVVGQDSGAGGDEGAPARQQPAEQHQEPGPAPPRASMLTEPGDGIADRADFFLYGSYRVIALASFPADQHPAGPLDVTIQLLTIVGDLGFKLGLGCIPAITNGL